MTALGENIRNCRERAGISQEELALKIRVGTHKIERYESGEQTPEMETVLKISTVLDVPASELMERIYQTNHSGIDHEIEQLVKEMGTKKAKLILRKAKGISDEDFLRVMDVLYEIKYKKA
ncbi:helix-turn-helix transcriptional regulator [Bacillus sp. REN3]|uniref:helix-turn-helix domain-containing protein n=1 Tax=Bacillus sp. REN3 TaxID=2802440 RepID=UPI001AEE82A3|nr:helix-turn-helix transcriptional regulator [Bacillus sp. REN3]